MYKNRPKSFQNLLVFQRKTNNKCLIILFKYTIHFVLLSHERTYTFITKIRI